MEEKVLAKGVKGRVEFDGSVIHIVESGLFGDKGSTDLRIKDITSVEVKKSGLVVGYIHFNVHGGKVGGGVRDEPLRDLTVTFRSNNDGFLELADNIDRAIQRAREARGANSMVPIADRSDAAAGARTTGPGRFCSNCGAPQQPGARFCAACGSPSAAIAPLPVTSEVCEIRLASDQPMIGSTKYQFIAEAVGPDGAYVAAASEPFKPASYVHDLVRDHVATRQLSLLVSQLTSDGWQPTGRATEWYSHTFRR